MKQDTIVIFDYGSQYTRLIARRLRDLNIFCDLVTPDIDKNFFKDRNIKGFILSGGPNSVFEKKTNTRGGLFSSTTFVRTRIGYIFEMKQISFT